MRACTTGVHHRRVLTVCAGGVLTRRYDATACRVSTWKALLKLWKAGTAKVGAPKRGVHGCRTRTRGAWPRRRPPLAPTD